jgi:hypothetical protein
VVGNKNLKVYHSNDSNPLLVGNEWSISGHDGKEKKSLFLPRIEPLPFSPKPGTLLTNFPIHF